MPQTGCNRATVLMMMWWKMGKSIGIITLKLLGMGDDSTGTLSWRDVLFKWYIKFLNFKPGVKCIMQFLSIKSYVTCKSTFIDCIIMMIVYCSKQLWTIWNRILIDFDWKLSKQPVSNTFNFSTLKIHYITNIWKRIKKVCSKKFGNGS